jgi:hypothetical protein
MKNFIDAIVWLILKLKSRTMSKLVLTLHYRHSTWILESRKYRISYALKLSIGCLSFINHWQIKHNQNNVWLTNFKVLFCRLFTHNFL